MKSSKSGTREGHGLYLAWHRAVNKDHSVLMADDFSQLQNHCSGYAAWEMGKSGGYFVILFYFAIQTRQLMTANSYVNLVLVAATSPNSLRLK